MPKCYICDKDLTEVHLDGRDMKPRPCSECEEIINEIVQEYDEDTEYTYINSNLHEYDEELEPDCEANLGDT